MKQLSVHPSVADSALVTDSKLGQWTEIGKRVSFVESELGDYSYVVHDSDIIYTTIGKFSNIASFVRINPGNHPMERASLHHFMYRSKQYGLGEDDEEFFNWRRSHHCTIGHDSWLGHASTIMAGVSIGTGAVVGSSSVVTKDVPDYAIVAGNPARVIRYRHPPRIQQSLLRIKWWDWDHDSLRERMKDFRRLSIDEFCSRYDPEF